MELPDKYKKLLAKVDYTWSLNCEEGKEALLLLKEAMKALEMVVEYCPKGCEDGDKKVEIYGHKEARETLRKFKEWK